MCLSASVCLDVTWGKGEGETWTARSGVFVNIVISFSFHALHTPGSILGKVHFGRQTTGVNSLAHGTFGTWFAFPTMNPKPSVVTRSL